MTSDPYSLSNLHDIVEPTAISVWPLAPGVWLLLALVAVWVAAGAVLWWIRWRRNAYRRAALRELSQLDARIRSPQTSSAALRDLGVFLKRVVLAAYPREQAASLTGDAWLAFLDQTMSGREFSQGVGRLLPSILYTSSDVPESDMNELVDLTARWVRTHRAPIES